MNKLIIVAFCLSSCYGTKKLLDVKSESKIEKLDSNYISFFRILDSASNATPNDSIIQCCIGPIAFMERTTGIPASSEGTFVGKLYFTKGDLRRWHEWYDEKLKILSLPKM